MAKLVVKNLHARVDEKEILKGVNLEINPNEVHAIMGPNGTGKSTLSAIIMGNPKYEVTAGEILLDGENILEMEVDERARAGIFLAMQYPSEISGITNSDFIRAAIKARGDIDESLFKYVKRLESSVEELKMNTGVINRYLNEGFSGGEKKRNEILQMKMLKPKVAILDEIDSGLDIDALTVVGNNLTQIMKEEGQNTGMLLITHYQRLLDFIKPTHVHIMLDGKIVESGDFTLAQDLEVNGYEAFKLKYNIVDETEEQKQITINQCATAMGVK